MARFFRLPWALTLLAVVAFSTTAPGNPNFTGTWVLDRSKSDMRQMRNLEAVQDASLTMVVDQQGNLLHVTRTFKIEGEEKQEVHTYKTDGTETTNTGLRGESVVTRANWEGDKLVVVSIRKISMLVRDITVESRGVWSLSPDGKTLTIEGTVHTPRGAQQMRWVFDRR
jgi:hypothetical protein